jgi:dienelactone hydrolase
MTPSTSRTSIGFAPNLDGYVDAPLDLQRHVGSRTLELLAAGERRSGAARTPAQVSAHADRVREAVLKGIGGLPPRTSTSPEVTWHGRIEEVDHVLHRLLFTSLPGIRVPSEEGQEQPAVLFLCGHTDLGKSDPEYQAVCARLAAAGMVVLVLDPWGQGERLGDLDEHGTPRVPPGTAQHTCDGIPAWWAGSSIARYFVHDARRGIDLLASLPFVDPLRIGVTGNSGGGMLCTLLAALEPRIAAAAIGTYVTSRAAYLPTGKHQDAEQILLGGTRAGVDHADLLACLAPRPLAVLAADFDFFPIEGTLATMERVRETYRVFGRSEAARLVRVPDTHRYGPGLADAAALFFRETLRPDLPDRGGRSRVDGIAPAHPEEDLRCTASGQVLRDDAGARSLHDLLVSDLGDGGPGAGPSVPGADQTDADPAAWLNRRVHADRRRPVVTVARWLPGPDGTLHGFWRSERDLWGSGVLIPPESNRGSRPSPPATLLLREAGTRDLTLEDPGIRARRENPLLILDLRGHGSLSPRDKDGLDPTSTSGAAYKQLCDLLFLGDSLLAGRAFDVTRAIDVLTTDQYLLTRGLGTGGEQGVRLVTDGACGLAALVAAAVDPRIGLVELSGMPTDPIRMVRTCDGHRDGAWQDVLPGMARHAPLGVLGDLLGDRVRWPRTPDQDQDASAGT